VGNPERSKRWRRQKQRKVVVGTKKLTSFFVPVATVTAATMIAAMMIAAMKMTYLSNKHNRVKGYLALTLKLPINPCGQIWAAPAKFGRKSSISTGNISTNFFFFDKRVV